MENENIIFGKKLNGGLNPKFKKIIGGVVAIGIFIAIVSIGQFDWQSLQSTKVSSSLAASVDLSQESPRIVAIEPKSGMVGDIVKITGANFDFTPENNTVKFGDFPAVVKAVGTAQMAGAMILEARVPDIPKSGNYTISIQTGGQTALSADSFLLTPVSSELIPKITKIEPDSANVGEIVYIFGENFSELASKNTVAFPDKFGGIVRQPNLEFVYVGDKPALKLTVPNGAQTGRVSVSVDDKKSESDFDFTVLVPEIPQPQIISFKPLSAQPGDLVSLVGKNLNDIEEIFIGSEKVAIDAISSDGDGNDVIKFFVPASAVSANVRVITSVAEAASDQIFEVLQPEVLQPEILEPENSVEEISEELLEEPKIDEHSPRDLVAINSRDGVRLNWQAPTAEIPLVGYRVYYSTNGYDYLHRRDAGMTTDFTVDELADGQKYFFVVTGVLPTGEETPTSNEVEITFLPQFSLPAASTPTAVLENVVPSFGSGNVIAVEAPLHSAPTIEIVSPIEVVEPHFSTQKEMPAELSEEGPREVLLFSILAAIVGAGIFTRKKIKIEFN